MGLLSWIVLGAVAGWVASLIMGRSHGCCLNVVIGIVGAFLGGFIVQVLTGAESSVGFDLKSFAMAIVGAVVLLAIAGLFGRRRR
jgi:LPXTG-motif cell wall-anchored protein